MLQDCGKTDRKGVREGSGQIQRHPAGDDGRILCHDQRNWSQFRFWVLGDVPVVSNCWADQIGPSASSVDEEKILTEFATHRWGTTWSFSSEKEYTGRPWGPVRVHLQADQSSEEILTTKTVQEGYSQQL